MATQRFISRERLIGLLACFFLSGAAALVYQVAWVQALGLIFGHTAYAVATVLAVFMGGIAAGTAYIGRCSERSAHPAALYARIELVIGLTGVLSLPGLHVLHSGYLAVYPAIGHVRLFLFAIRFFGSAAVLFIPTFLMGGTFPILVAATTQGCEELPLRVSQLYWINTAGGALGTIFAGFVLLPALGLRLTIGAAAALNGLAGVLAFWIGKGWTHSANHRRPKEAAERTDRNPREAPYRALLWVMGAVGCTAFAYEIAWTRLLAITIGSSTYAFTLMLAAFLAGIVIGGAIFQRYFSRSPGRISLAALSWIQIGIGLTSLSSLVLFHWIPSLIPHLLLATNRTFSGLVITQFITTALTVLPAAVVFGVNFPAMIALLDRKAQRGPGRSVTVGTAYAANTAGAIAGCLLTGFWLVPWLGSFRVVAAVVAVNLIIALSIHLASQPRHVAVLITDGVLLAAAFLVASSSFFYNQSLLQFSAVLYGGSYQGRLTLAEIAATKDLVFAAEGVNDSVAVVRTDGDVELRLNGKVDASTQDSRTQLLLGHLGAAFHGSPKRVLVIGFGSGMTVSAVARYADVQKIDCVEMEPEVLRAAPFLQSLNRNVLRDPRVHIIFDDARNFLLTSRGKYDLIISEPSNPWIAGVATLFTDEYYAAARQQLARGGMFVQWMQAYSLAPADLRMIAATFGRHFPEVTLWRAGETDLLLLGRTEVSPLRFDRLRSLWADEALRNDFQSLEIHRPEGLVAYFLLDDAAVRELGKGAALNTDNRTLLEYDAPKSLLRQDLIGFDGNLIGHFRQKPVPPNLESSEFGSALHAGLATALDLNDANAAKAFLNAIGSEADSATHAISEGRLALLDGAIPQARQCMETAFRSNPKSADAAYWLAVADRRNGDEASALSHIAQALRLDPHFLPALESEMDVAEDKADYQSALSAQLSRMALMTNPPAYEYGRLGALWIATSDFTRAESALLQGLKKDPYCYACHAELGELYLRTGKLALARQNYEWVVRFFPDSSASIYRLLIEIDLTMRDTHSARRVLNEGLRLFPEDKVLIEAENRLYG